MLDSEGIHCAKNSQGHECNLPSVVIPIPLWQSGHNHIRVTNCFYLQYVPRLSKLKIPTFILLILIQVLADAGDCAV